VDEFDFSRLLKKEYPKIDIRAIPLHFDTRGAAETIYIATTYMGKESLSRRTVSLDCDTIYFKDILTEIRNLPTGTSGTVFFQDTGDKPLYSYVKLNEEGFIVDIQEKKAISRNANTGAYS
jgi:choline kinase